MNDLTEQWEKGKLPDGWYYVKGNRAEGIYAYTAEYLNNMYRPRNGEIIIEQVPSYEQWQAKLDENTKLKTENKWYSEQLNEASKEIEKLKELLKECKRQFEEVELYRCDVADTDQEDWFKISTNQANVANKMIAKINQVLGEKQCTNI
jgi:hypothetical protein